MKTKNRTNELRSKSPNDKPSYLWWELKELDKPIVIACGNEKSVAGHTSGIDVWDITARRPDPLHHVTQNAGPCVPWHLLYLSVA